MRTYIDNLTDTLIGEHSFQSIFMKLETDSDHRVEFVEVAKHILEFENVACMSPETLGKIVCAFESGDVLSLHSKDEVKFTGDCSLMLRELVAVFLAYAIDKKLREKLSRGKDNGMGGLSFLVGIRPTYPVAT